MDDPYVCMRPKQVGLVIDRIHGAAAGLEAVNMSEILSKFANDMVCRAVAGRSFRVEGRDRIFRDLIAQAFDILGGINLESFYPGLANAAGGVLLWPALRKAEKLRDRWSELLDKLIEQHSSGEGAGEDEQETDFIHVLLAVEEEYGLTRDNIRGILSVSISFILLPFSSMFGCTCLGSWETGHVHIYICFICSSWATEHVRSRHGHHIPSARVRHGRAHAAPGCHGQATGRGAEEPTEQGTNHRRHRRRRRSRRNDDIPESRHKGDAASTPAGAAPRPAPLAGGLRRRRLHDPVRHAAARQRLGDRSGPQAVGRRGGVRAGEVRPRRRRR
jgi:hypothetical protein